MLRNLGCLILLGALAEGAAGQTPDETVRLKISPAPSPVPALKYELLPNAEDIAPGNAVQVYYRAFSPEWYGWLRQPGIADKVEETLKTPISDIAKFEQQASTIGKSGVRPIPRDSPGTAHISMAWLKDSKQLREIDLASRREYCDWEFTARIKKDGFSMLLPDVQSFRQFANLLAVRARLEMAENNFSAAVYTFQTALAMSRNLADAPILIDALVGAATANLTLTQVEDFMQIPGSPNLYWALTDLPRPFIGLRRPLSGEKLMLFAEVPLIKDIEKGPFSATQVRSLQTQVSHLVQDTQGGRPLSPAEELQMLAVVLKLYPVAKQALIAAGRKPQDVEALPVLQVVLIHSFQQFRRLQDNLYKWSALPCPEAWPGFEQAEQEVKEARRRMEAFPFIELLPAMQKALVTVPRLERRIAALRCVEAIRIYMAAHDGKLPATLDDIKSVPIPQDPATNKPFAYEVTGAKAILSAPRPPWAEPESERLRYELQSAR
jgi:hypothetical protein